MNGLELSAWVATIGLLLVLARLFLGSWRAAGLVTLLCAAPIYLSLSESSQLLTIDEFAIYGDLRSTPSHGSSQWNLGALRTTLALTAPLASYLEDAGPDAATLLMVVKAYHWLTALPFILGIGLALYKILDPLRQRALFFVAYCWLVFLLPVDNLAMKVLNYDAISLFGGVLAVLLVTLGLQSGRITYAVLAVGVAALAAQEKVIASPILLLAIVVLAPVAARSRPTAWYRAGAYGLVLGLGLACGVIYTSGLLWTMAMPLREPSYWLSLFDPLISWTWLPLRFGFASTDFHELRGLSSAITLVALVAAALLALYGARRLNEHPCLLDRLVGGLDVAVVAVLLVVLGVGVIGLLTLQPFVAPYSPSAGVDLGNVGVMNGIQIHFNATSLLQHRIEFVAFVYATFVAGLPSVLWATLAVTMLLRLRYGAIPRRPALDLALLVGLLGPLPVGLLLVPPSHRYLNVMILITALAILAKCLDSLRMLPTDLASQRWVLGLSTLGALGLLLEVAPFGPLYAAFRPIWANYADPAQPIVGKANASWVGWGEEVMLAGKRLEAECLQSSDGLLDGVACSDITLHSIYQGGWIVAQAPIKSKLCCTPGQQPLSNADYYLINRASVVFGFPFPYGIEPDFVVDFRGFVQAWVFRGDHLAAGGYRFP
jgi:hypothetical protein